MTIQEYITHNRPLLHRHMQQYGEEKKQQLAALPRAKDRLDEILQFARGGKNLRGMQLLFAHDATGGKHPHRALDLAAAVELTHAAGLTHDDIVDNDMVRHGKPSIYAGHMQQAKLKGYRNPLLFGQSQAIWLGDLGLFLSFELMKSVAHHPHGPDIISRFSQEIQRVCIAEMNETILASSTYEPSEQEILEIYTYKTGRYSIVMPLSLGVLLGDTDDRLLYLIEQFGLKVGVIFQMKDDEMGLFGDEKATGKPVGSDIRENKKTLYRALLYKKSSESERAQLNTIFGKEDITPQDITLIAERMQQYGIREDIAKRLKKLETETNSILESMHSYPALKSYLQQFLELNLKRTQ